AFAVVGTCFLIDFARAARDDSFTPMATPSFDSQGDFFMDRVRRALSRRLTLLLLAGLFLLWLGQPAPAQDVVLNKEAYVLPPKVIADAILAPRHENISLTNLSPDGKKFVITKTDGMISLDRMAHSHVYLAEMAFDPVASRARELWIRSAAGFDLYYYAENRTVPVQ